MHFEHKHVLSLISLAEVVYRNPSISALCQYLAMSICPSGELSRVYIGRLDNDGFIRTLASFGYSVGTDIANLITPIDFDGPMPDAVRNRKIIVESQEGITRKYPHYDALDPQSPWGATAIVPTLGNIVFVFRLQSSIDESEFYKSYFDFVKVILSFYNIDLTSNSKSDSENSSLRITKQNIEKLLGSALTKRQ